MGNSRKPSAPIKGQVREMKPLTPEERQEQAARLYMQKRESIATGVLFNLMHNPNVTSNSDAASLVDVAIEVADRMLEKLYFTPSEKEEK